MDEQRAEKLLKDADDLVVDMVYVMDRARSKLMNRRLYKIDCSDLPAVYTTIRDYQEQIASLIGTMNTVLDCLEDSMEEIDDAIYAKRNKELECTAT